MIYAQVAIYPWDLAFVTADTPETFLKVFCEIVNECIDQYENRFLVDIGEARRNTIRKELEDLQETPPDNLEVVSLSFREDVSEFSLGVIGVEAIYRTREEVLYAYQDYVDELNAGLSSESGDERWAVFGGGFFPEENGYEMGDLFK